MTYQPMPSAPPPGRPPAKGPAPSQVVLAVRLMFTNAALAVVSGIVLFSSKGALRDALHKSDSSLSPSELDDQVGVIRAVALVIGLIFLVLYVLLALQVGKGKNWARIVTWVLAGLGVLSALSALASTGTALSKTFNVVTGIIDVVIIVLLARSNDYFAKVPGYGPPPGYPPGYGRPVR